VSDGNYLAVIYILRGLEADEARRG